MPMGGEEARGSDVGIEWAEMLERDFQTTGPMDINTPWAHPPAQPMELRTSQSKKAATVAASLTRRSFRKDILGLLRRGCFGGAAGKTRNPASRSGNAGEKTSTRGGPARHVGRR
jgi:hypothetical protein